MYATLEISLQPPASRQEIPLLTLTPPQINSGSTEARRTSCWSAWEQRTFGEPQSSRSGGSSICRAV